MKEYLNNFIRFTLIIITSTILQSCGGSSDEKADKYSISANTSSISFSNEFLKVSDDTFKIDVTFQGNGLLIGYAPGSQAAAWLNYRTENVTATSATLYVDVVNVDNIIANLYQTKLRLSTGDVDKINLVHHDIDISLLIWQLITDKEIVSFRGTLGDTSISEQTIAITSEANEWIAEANVEWLSLDKTSGTGDDIITITPNITNFSAAQLYQAQITLTESTTGDSKVIPVEVGLDKHYLFSEQSTVSLSRLANLDATSKTVSINTNSPLPINWQATSNVDWLTLSKTENSNQLSIKVKNNVSFNQAQNHAIITINAIDNENNIDESVIAESIKLSFYQSSELSENKVIEALKVNANALANSPYLPVIYIGNKHQLHVYHQYTGELLKTLDVAPDESLLEQFIIHPDGDFLLAKAVETIVNEDETTTATTHRYRINLNDYTFTEILDTTIEYEPLRYVSFSGRHFIVTQTLEFADDELKRLFWNPTNAFLTTRVDQASITEAFYALDLSNATFKRYKATINDFTTQAIVVEETHQYHPELLEEGQAISNFVVTDNETGIYAISPTSEWISFDGETYVDNGLLPQAEGSINLTLTKSHNSRAHYMRFNAIDGFLVDIYDESQSLVNTISTQGQQPDSVTLSQDDKRLIIDANNAEQLEIINIEQFNVSSSTLSFDTTSGNSIIDSQTLTITGISNDWQATSNNDWLVIETATVDGNSTITVSINQSNLSGWGLYTGSITITDPLSGSSRIITVKLAVDEVRLFSDQPALAFSQQFDRAVLSHTINILTNRETHFAWSAQTDANWLTLTPNLVDNTLKVTVDPNVVTSFGEHSAKITLSPQNATDSINGLIEVSFSKGDFDTSTLSEIVIENITPNTSGIVLDPKRPYIYIAQGDKVSVFNIIDGSEVTSISSLLPDVNLTNLIIHPDGSLLIMSNEETYLDENEQEATRLNFYQLDLVTYTISHLANEDVDVVYSPQEIVMVAGKPIVVTQGLEFANLSLQQQYWDNSNVFLTSIIDDVKGNDTIIAYNAAAQNLVHHTLSYNAFAEKSISLKSKTDYINPAFANNILNIATSSDGSNIYTTNAASEWSTYNGTEFADQGLLDGNPFTSPVKVIVDSANNSYLYRFDFTIGFFTLSKYDNTQANVWTTGYSAGSVDVYLSADYHRVIHYNADASQLVLDYMPN